MKIKNIKISLNKNLSKIKAESHDSNIDSEDFIKFYSKQSKEIVEKISNYINNESKDNRQIHISGLASFFKNLDKNLIEYKLYKDKCNVSSDIIGFSCSFIIEIDKKFSKVFNKILEKYENNDIFHIESQKRKNNKLITNLNIWEYWIDNFEDFNNI